jgi:hypothetical protein
LNSCRNHLDTDNPVTLLPSFRGEISCGEKGSVMRINALAILFAVGAFGVAPAGAQTVQQESAPLPQFMPPEARAHVVERSAGTNPAADETRRAAEALSAKFSGDLAVSDADVATDVAKPEMAAPIATNPQANSPPSAHVAVLRASESPATSVANKSKNQGAQSDTPLRTSKTDASKASNASKSKQMKTRAERSPSSRRTAINSYGNGQALASNSVPGADTGWQTGIIGMLTNPAFWH